MIIKGGARSGPQELGEYLTTNEANERIEVAEVRGTVATDVPGALKEMDALANGARCKSPLYHAQISPEPPYRLTPEQRAEAIDTLEKSLGFEGHQRVVVIHEKNDREHLHVVWSRIEPGSAKAVSISFNYRKHEETARELERRFGHPRVQGAHAERENVERPERTLSRAEIRQQEKTGIFIKDVRTDITAAYRSSDGASAFRKAIEDQGYVLARGDRRDFVVVDRAGGIHGLARRIEGMEADELRKYMKPIKQEHLPSATMARKGQIARSEGRGSALDDYLWEEKLRESGLEAQRKAEREAAKKFRESAIKWEAEQKARRADKARSRANARRQRKYSRSDDFGNQTAAAQKHHEKRQKKLNKGPRPKHPSDHRSPTMENDFRDAQAKATRPEQSQANDAATHPKPDQSYGDAFQGRDYNAAADKDYEAAREASDSNKGFDQARAAEEAMWRDLEQREREREKAKDTSKDRPASERQERSDSRELDEETLNRIQRLLNEEKWEPRLDDDDLAPDRQHEVSGRGRTRNR